MTSASSIPADTSDLVRLAREVATDVAARLVEALDGAGPQISAKSTPTDLVTDLDRWAEQHIAERILAVRPDDGLEGEEGASVGGTSGITWCVDPIDGTVNFVHGLPGFCVSIAAQVEGRSVAGAVVSPLHHDTFEAELGRGALLNGRPIHCADPPSLARSVVGTGFGYDPERRRRQAEVVTRVIGDIADIRRAGAAALDLCSVGAARLDAFWEVGLNAWDHAAGALVASEAGARVEGLDGAAPSEAFVLAAPPSIWDDLAALLVSTGAPEV